MIGIPPDIAIFVYGNFIPVEAKKQEMVGVESPSQANGSVLIPESINVPEVFVVEIILITKGLFSEDVSKASEIIGDISILRHRCSPFVFVFPL
jgi:hypothetical protein